MREYIIIKLVYIRGKLVSKDILSETTTYKEINNHQSEILKIHNYINDDTYNAIFSCWNKLVITSDKYKVQIIYKYIPL